MAAAIYLTIGLCQCLAANYKARRFQAQRESCGEQIEICRGEEAKRSNAIPEATTIAVWTDHLSAANRAIDIAHKHIIGEINKVESLIGAKDVAALTEIFKFFEDCLCADFGVEEKIAWAVSVDFAHHKLTHQRLLKDFYSMKKYCGRKKWQVAGQRGGHSCHSLGQASYSAYVRARETR